ncbi:MAG: Ribonuclease P protein component [Cytophagales bacterium]|jgi:ribonuclease P protein component|nr:ribonuclease P protein component [Bacteroidota bacterium]MBS1981914.1 ribonuclease P protein component [Bacteroidota bacterium]WHZ07539.1 MAG: Ribonuclease P protein component [Cytophagales bacterium]
MGQFSFSKAERLTGKTNIQELFAKGSSFYLHPFKIIYLPTAHEKAVTNQILISVPKSNFKKAVDRNTIKRRIREGYRLNKNILSQNPKMRIAYIYTPREIISTSVIHDKVKATLKKVKEKCIAKK